MDVLQLRARLVLLAGVVLALIGGLGVSSHSTSEAAASSPSTLSVYLDIPFVQGTYASSVVSQDFDSSTLGETCPTIAGGTFSGDCKVEGAWEYGGATVSADVPAPTVGGSAVGRYVSTSGKITIDFNQDQRYLGLWWSAGSVGNSVEFFKENTSLLTVTTETIMALLGNGPGWDQNNDAWDLGNDDSPSNVVTSLNSTPHRKMWYFGNPRGYSWPTPSDRETLERSDPTLRPGEPFVYIHMLADGNLTFDRVELVATSSGFEFDNLAVSTTAQTPNPRLVLVGQEDSTQFAVRFEPNGTAVEGSMPNQVGTSLAALTTNTYTRDGFSFAGWATSAKGSGTRFADGADYDFESDLTLYAQWRANSQPSSGGDAPATPTTGSTLAATGSAEGALLVLSALSLMVGLLLIAQSRRLRRR
jgi:uncharacterized repeat protein (TIGR02543 family)